MSNFYKVSIILFLVAVLSWVNLMPFGSTAPMDELKNFPSNIGEWRGTDVKLESEVFQILETKNMLVKDYQNSQRNRINLFIVSSGFNRRVAHPPEICLQGAGATVVERAQVELTKNIAATQLIIETKNYQEMAVYWYKTGNEYTSSYLVQQVRVFLKQLIGQKAPVSMVRLIVPIRNNDRKAAFRSIRSFAVLIEPLLKKYLP